ncbi:DNA cytosine methyltransferase [Oscillospiraceae bacterium 21-37]
MVELRGKYASAKVFTNIVDEASISQVINLLNQPYINGSVVRIMPDIHAGAGCTIGTTMTINVKNVLTRYNRHNFDRYISELEKLGYTSSYAVLDARDFGLPQARERVFTVSTLSGDVFDFDDLIRTPMQNIQSFLMDNSEVPEVYNVTQPSILEAIGKTGIRRATVIRDYAFTVTTRQDRTPAQVIDCGNGRYRYLTELECWRLQGYTDEDYRKAELAQNRVGRYYMALYKQAGNSIAVPIFESIFRKILLGETAA